jgi:hypothetical protein
MFNTNARKNNNKRNRCVLTAFICISKHSIHFHVFAHEVYLSISNTYINSSLLFFRSMNTTNIVFHLLPDNLDIRRTVRLCG